MWSNRVFKLVNLISPNRLLSSLNRSMLVINHLQGPVASAKMREGNYRLLTNIMCSEYWNPTKMKLASM